VLLSGILRLSRQLKRVQRIQLEVTLGNDERIVRLVKANAQEKRLVSVSPE